MVDVLFKFFVAMKAGRWKKRRKKGILSCYLCSFKACGSLWLLRGFSYCTVYTDCTRSRFLQVSLINLANTDCGTSHVKSMCSSTCMHCACDSHVPGAIVARFTPSQTYPFAQNKAPCSPLCHTFNPRLWWVFVHRLHQIKESTPYKVEQPQFLHLSAS